MKFEIRQVGKYLGMEITFDNTSIDMLMDEKERCEMAMTLVSAAYQLLPQTADINYAHGDLMDAVQALIDDLSE